MSRRDILRVANKKEKLTNVPSERFVKSNIRSLEHNAFLRNAFHSPMIRSTHNVFLRNTTTFCIFIHSYPRYMANTYTQIHIQFVFAVKYREALIQKEWKEELHKYITGIIQENNHKMLQINSMPDHIHIFIGMRPMQSIAALVQNVKTESSKWVKEKRFCDFPFAWQEGYGAFSYSKSYVQNVIRYIQNQEVHHKKETFLDEYRQMLKGFEIEFDEQYIFKEPE
jgi:putative transposase